MNRKLPRQPGYPNLRVIDTEEARKMGIKGGKARWEKERQRRSIAEEIKIALNSPIQPSHPKYAEIKRMARTMGLDSGGDPTNQLIMVMGLLIRAQKDPAAATFLRDTAGEKPVERQEVSVNAPPVQIGIHDPAFIESERAKIEAADNSLVDSNDDDGAETRHDAHDAKDEGMGAPSGKMPPEAVSAQKEQRQKQESTCHPSKVPIVITRGRR